MAAASTPASMRAPSSMSPLAPLKQSKWATRTGRPSGCGDSTGAAGRHPGNRRVLDYRQPTPWLTLMPDHLAALAALAHAEGGWGYTAGQPGHLEPTCLALLALRPAADRHAAAVGAGRAF